mgnify:FL=1
MTGVAVKVTEPPAQIEVVLAAIVTDGVTVVAVMVTALLVAVTGLAQGSLEVMITVTISPLTRVVVVNVAAISPVTSMPLICHW